MPKKVFIVEDDLDIIGLYMDALKTTACEIVGIAKNGAEAIEKYTALKSRPDVILMDNRMPGKNGIEATKEILRIDSGARIIFFSADQDVEEEARRIGAVDFKNKPFSIDTIVKCIEEI